MTYDQSRTAYEIDTGRRLRRGPRQALRRPQGAARRQTFTLPPGASSACSATTAPARRPPSASSPRSRCPTHRHARASPASTSSPTPPPCARASASPARPPPSTACSPPREPRARRAPLPPAARDWSASARGELLERLRPRRGRATGSCKTFSGGMRRRLDLAASAGREPAGAVPRRAHDRPRPAQPQRALGAAAASSSREGMTLCSPPSTSRRPTASPTRSSCSTTARWSPSGTPAELKARIGGERLDVTRRRRREARPAAAALAASPTAPPSSDAGRVT